MLIVILTVKKLEFRVDKVIRETVINSVTSGKVFGLIKKIQYKCILYKASKYFPKPYQLSDGNIKFELDLPYYVTKIDLKAAAGVAVSNLVTKSDLPSLKGEVDRYRYR